MRLVVEHSAISSIGLAGFLVDVNIGMFGTKQGSFLIVGDDDLITNRR